MPKDKEKLRWSLQESTPPDREWLLANWTVNQKLYESFGWSRWQAYRQILSDWIETCYRQDVGYTDLEEEKAVLDATWFGQVIRAWRLVVMQSPNRVDDVDEEARILADTANYEFPRLPARTTEQLFGSDAKNFDTEKPKRGRKKKEESEARHFALLAEASKNPQLLNFPEQIAQMFKISEKQANRDIAKIRQKQVKLTQRDH